MKIHPTSIDGFDTLEEAAVAVGKMRYDAIAVFLRHLVSELSVQQDKDAIVGKKQLAEDTDMVLNALGDASGAADELFMKYKKFMEEELALTGEIEYNPSVPK